MIHITEEQVRRLLPMRKAIELVEDAFQKLDSGRLVNHPRRRVVLENRSILHYMSAGDNQGGWLGTKVYATSPRSGASFLVVLFDPSGATAATLEANALGQIRTGAATGVATRHLAREDAGALGMIGTGYQARAQLEAVAAVRPLRQVKVYSRSLEKRRRFATEMAEHLDLAIEAVGTPEQAVRGSDIVVTITNARQPVLRGEWLSSGCHVNAAGSNHVKRREIDGLAVERPAVVTVDSLEQARMEAGDLTQAIEEGRLEWARVQELGGVVSGRLKGRTSPEEITLFESQGLAIEDLAAATYIYQQFRGELPGA